MDRRQFLGKAAAAAGLLPLWPNRLRAFQKDAVSEGTATIRFEEIAAKSGLHFVTENSPTPNKNQIETMAGGVGFFDYDRDGYLDVYLVNGAAFPRSAKNLRRIGTACFTTTMTERLPT